MNKRIVISGTYSTGKTTTAKALSIATGIPMVSGLSAREILTEFYPGRKFEDISLEELMVICLKRFEERVKSEEKLMNECGTFISDGSVLNEYIYGSVRLKTGINPGAPMLRRALKRVQGYSSRHTIKKYLKAYDKVVSIHAKKYYTNVVHLPIEFEMDPDGHRPVSESYRRISDEEIYLSFLKRDFDVEIVRGSQVQRIIDIAKKCNLELVVDPKKAIELANQEISSSREMVSEKIIEQSKDMSLREKISVLSKF